MALCPCFCNLTNLFFSLIPSDYERILKDEIWGCTHYMKLPMETVMKLPIQDRRYYIHKHNEEQQDIRSRQERATGTNRTYDGEAINEYAKLEQENAKNRRRG